MNLLSIQDDLKNVSDQDLARMMRSPDSAAPSYLVLSEIRRRKDMRTRAGDAPQRTVAEDLIDVPQTYSDAEGIRSLRVPGYEEEERTGSDMDPDGVGIEAMRAGGIVRMADGGEVMPPPPNPATGTAGINMQDIMQRNMGLIPGIPQELMDRLRASRSNEGERRQEAQRNALIEAGLRIAASNNPRLAGAIGEGALPAVQSYNQQLGELRRDQRAELQQEMAAAQADIQRRYMAGQLSAAEYRSAMDMTGRREIAQMQIAAQRAQSGASEARQDRRDSRQAELDTARRHGLGQFTPTEWAGLSDEQKAAVRERIELTRPQRADVSGFSAAAGPLGVRLNTLRADLDNLGARPPATTGFFGNPNPARAEYDEKKERLQREYEFVDRQYRNAITGVTETPRAGAARSGTNAPTPTGRPPISSFMGQ